MIGRLQSLRLIPVVALQRAEDAEPLADALCAGGLPCAEITLRTDAALDAIRALAGRDDFLLGAGTIHSAEQAAVAVEAGARFVVTPGFNPRTVKWCQENEVPVFPGIATPTDLELALEHGLEIVKFFPAETLGGVPTLKAFSGPYGDVQFIPTGGINAGNLADYLALPSVLACGGSWMVKAGDWEETTRLTTEALKIIGE
jgi:2-dehydro-3-deoxyphosphogluconate aldolase/(4S)-4-hydroxy-2-oxoglutarate aldolase